MNTPDLLGRYLHAVRFWLPKAQQHDILAELAEDLHSQIEEREASLGRALDEDDLAAILKKRGSPMKVASSYLAGERLINPAMLPAYRLVLKIALICAFVPLLANALLRPILTSTLPEQALLPFFAAMWRNGFMIVGIVTAVFFLFDRYHVKLRAFDNWDPRKLPRVPAATETPSRWKHLAGFLFGMLGAMFWTYALWQRTEFAFGDGVRILLGPVWSWIFWPVLVLTVARASVDLLSFVYPCWAPVRSRALLAINACMLAIVVAQFAAGNWVEIVIPNLSAEKLDKVSRWADASIELTLLGVAIANIVEMVVEFRRGAKPAGRSIAAISG